MRIAKNSRQKLWGKKQKILLAIFLVIILLSEVFFAFICRSQLALPGPHAYPHFWEQRLHQVRQHYLEVFEYKNQLKKFMPHPYWGYQYDCQQMGHACNNFGFNDERDFPYIKGERDVVLGIFGGSVAQQVAQYMKKNENWQRRFREANHLEGINLIILNFALGGAKQPQQYAISTFFLETLDFAINIDGYNEVIYNNHFIFPLEFPWLSDFLYTPGRGKDLLDEAWSLVELRHYLARPFRHLPLLKYSPTLLFAWEKLDRFFEAKFLAFFPIGQDLPHHRGNPYYPQELAGEKSYAAMSDIWARYTQMQNDLLTAAKIPHLFFLQPNQYVQDSRPLLSSEQLDKIIDPQVGPGVALKYARLKKEVEKMQKQKIPIHDLTQVFSQSTEEVYSDKCCHLTELGAKIVAESVLETVASSPWQRLAPLNDGEEDQTPSSVFFYDRKKK